MDEIKFAFVELLKGTGLAVGGILAAKAIAGLGRQDQANRRGWLWLKGALYAALLGAVAAGSSMVGHDVAAELYGLASQRNFAHQQFQQACLNAERAVGMRPRVLRYWRLLDRSKLALRQFESVLADEPAVRSLSSGELSEVDAMQFAFAHFFLGQYDQAIARSQQVMRESRFYAPPYVLEGMAYTAEKKYQEAEQSYLGLLRMSPTNADAVRGLAQAYFLSGDRARAMKVLKDTASLPFSDEARHSFAQMKQSYAREPPAGESLAHRADTSRSSAEGQDRPHGAGVGP